jgi:segregation and condensation protein A
MERPVYHIPGVVQEKGGDPQDLVGPLDLILHLLKKNKVSLWDIPLTQLLEQYLDWVDRQPRLDLEAAGEFMTMASYLMVLKTRTLLAQEEEEAQSELETLAAMLEAREQEQKLVRIRAVLPRLEARYQAAGGSFPKAPEEKFRRRVYRYDHRKEDLTQALQGWRRRGKPALPSPEGFSPLLRREPYGVEEKVVELADRLAETGPCLVQDLLTAVRDRSEATAAFLALLELCRQGRVRFWGELDHTTVALV